MRRALKLVDEIINSYVVNKTSDEATSHIELGLDVFKGQMPEVVKSTLVSLSIEMVPVPPWHVF